MRTLLLDQGDWDLVLDAQGNIAVADEPYAIAQDVASAVRVFLGEVWFDTAQGVPYFTEVLGAPLNLSVLKSRIETTALTVPQVARARCLVATIEGRTLRGQIQVIDIDGNENNVSF